MFVLHITHIVIKYIEFFFGFQQGGGCGIFSLSSGRTSGILSLKLIINRY